jgi:3D (Asp-Asp-Asp) domain-containing protein
VGFLTKSLWRKALATVVAVFAFIALYGVTMRDSEVVDPNAPPAPGATLSVSATAYCKGSVTAAGVAVQNGAAASDRSLLPLGSVVQIDTGDPRYDGMYTILDTGPQIKGLELDIYMWSCHDALAFGRRQVRVTILRQGWNPRATPSPAPTLMQRIFNRPVPARPQEPLPSRPLVPKP